MSHKTNSLSSHVDKAEAKGGNAPSSHDCKYYFRAA